MTNGKAGELAGRRHLVTHTRNTVELEWHSVPQQSPYTKVTWFFLGPFPIFPLSFIEIHRVVTILLDSKQIKAAVIKQDPLFLGASLYQTPKRTCAALN